jgi:hypothetical protein
VRPLAAPVPTPSCSAGGCSCFCASRPRKNTLSLRPDDPRGDTIQTSICLRAARGARRAAAARRRGRQGWAANGAGCFAVTGRNAAPLRAGTRRGASRRVSDGGLRPRAARRARRRAGRSLGAAFLPASYALPFRVHGHDRLTDISSAHRRLRAQPEECPPKLLLRQLQRRVSLSAPARPPSGSAAAYALRAQMGR